MNKQYRNKKTKEVVEVRILYDIKGKPFVLDIFEKKPVEYIETSFDMKCFNERYEEVEND
tara:strand:- start:353 stop:532 length:180 start_codon:yes stop_codon:yes gene_type:complete